MMFDATLLAKDQQYDPDLGFYFKLERVWLIALLEVTIKTLALWYAVTYFLSRRVNP